VKGIILAGGSGSRLWPATFGLNKQLLNVYDKPLIHYPIATLMLAGIRDICIITTREDQAIFRRALGSGDQYGVHFEYFIQEQPNGLAEAFPITEEYIQRNSCALILGDNIFHGSGLGRHLQNFAKIDGAQIFAYKVSDPERYGVVSFDKKGKVISLEEKPKESISNFAVPGLYFYDKEVFEIARQIQPSSRGEVEITSINQYYLRKGKLQVSILPSGTAWMDTGTFSSLHDASSYVKALQERQGNKIACLEEIGYRLGWIDNSTLMATAVRYAGTEYAAYLEMIIESGT
jgi:glucose-1-phosphate thymidylyltransferase